MAKQAVIVLMVVIAFGILVPLYKGFGFLDPRIIAAYTCLALLFVAPASAQLAAPPSATRPSLGRMALIVAWGWGISVLILATAVATLNVVSGRGGFLAPPPDFLAALLTFSLSASAAIALFGAVLARRFSASVTKNLLRTCFLVILLGLAFGSRVLPETLTFTIADRFSTRRALTHLAWQGAAVSTAFAALLLLRYLWKKIPMKEDDEQGR